MTLIDACDPDAIGRLRALLGKIDGHKAEVERQAARILAIDAEIAKIGDTSRALETRKLALPAPPADAAARIMAGELIEDDAAERARRLNHNAVTDNAILLLGERVAALRQESDTCAAAMAREKNAAGAAKRSFYSLLSSAAYEASQGAMAGLIRDFLLPLYLIRIACDTAGASSDRRIAMTFDRDVLYMFRGSTDVMRIWPPTVPEMIVPGIDIDRADVLPDIIGAIGALAAPAVAEGA